MLRVASRRFTRGDLDAKRLKRNVDHGNDPSTGERQHTGREQERERERERERRDNTFRQAVPHTHTRAVSARQRSGRCNARNVSINTHAQRERERERGKSMKRETQRSRLRVNSSVSTNSGSALGPRAYASSTFARKLSNQDWREKYFCRREREMIRTRYESVRDSRSEAVVTDMARQSETNTRHTASTPSRPPSRSH